MDERVLEEVEPNVYEIVLVHAEEATAATRQMAKVSSGILSSCTPDDDGKRFLARFRPVSGLTPTAEAFLSGVIVGVLSRLYGAKLRPIGISDE
jgi:hypothetical protein